MRAKRASKPRGLETLAGARSSTTESLLVTGAAGGLGAAVVRRFADAGWEVHAADLTPPPEGDHVHPVAIDVTSDESVAAAVAGIGPLGAVVNFAGILRVGALIEMPTDQLERVLAINLLGTHRVNRAVFPLLQEGNGRIVNISSETGWQRPLPLNGAYATSKHAVEAYSDALRRELMFVGVPVVVIQPGPFRTPMTGGIGAAFEAATVPGSQFERLTRRIGRAAAREEANGHDPALLAEVVWRAVTAERPKARYSVQPDLQRSVLHRLPTGLTDRLLLRVLGRA